MKYLGFLLLALFVFLLGCGGGGGGGGGSSDGTTNGFTNGATDANPGSTIVGQIVSRDSNPVTPIAGVTVRFYDSGGSLLASAVSRANGYFDANIGTNAVKCDVDGSTVPNGYYAIFRYGSTRYQASSTSPSVTCRVPLPTIVPGVLTEMTNGAFKFVSLGPPDPPANGCLP
ncbi:MAG: hypothetical protein BGO01_06710 [Armatimonadetes bacterium 55-13]|nr:hypothetical protein [Armatimonadota bacterium]OJU65163.1 MAG: hypothetical protein BGO01_06710 [Armatimonadetes bacterium 55-13]